VTTVTPAHLRGHNARAGTPQPHSAPPKKNRVEYPQHETRNHRPSARHHRDPAPHPPRRQPRSVTLSPEQPLGLPPRLPATRFFSCPVANSISTARKARSPPGCWTGIFEVFPEYRRRRVKPIASPTPVRHPRPHPVTSHTLPHPSHPSASHGSGAERLRTSLAKAPRHVDCPESRQCHPNAPHDRKTPKTDPNP
jgi:hypothetical protein